MIVGDIFNDCRQVLARCSESEIFSRLTDAVEVMANKGQFEPLLGYVDIPIPSGSNVISLPNEIEMPIKVNIDNNPSYVRDRLYEFTLNGPGSNSSLSGWQWEDRGDVPIFNQVVSSAGLQQYTVSSVAADQGLTPPRKVIFTGWDANGARISNTITLSATPQSTSVYKTIERVTKDVTVGDVTVSAGMTTASTYGPNETEPRYRQIRLSKTGVTARIFFRRKTFKITSQNDFIPLHSKMAILMMLKANESYRNGSIDQMSLGKAYESQALSFLKEEQDSRNTFAELAGQDDQPIMGLNVNNRDSIIAGDLYDDAVKIFGKEGKQKTFDRMTESIEALANKSQWTGMEGYIDITVDGNTVTLPRYVEVPLSVNIGGRPSMARNKMFEFHLNGPGSECGGSTSWAWDDRGDVVTLSDVNYEIQLIAIPDAATASVDNGKSIRVFGYDADDKWIRTLNTSTNLYEDGFPVAISSSVVVPLTGAQKVIRITRITKDVTVGFVKLSGIDIPRNTTTVLGYYYPDETEPTYRRIRVGCSCGTVRMRYRKRTLKITSLTDPIHLKSKISVVTMMMSMAALGKGDVQASEMLEMKAVKFLSEEEVSRNPAQTFTIQYDTGTMWADPAQGII